MADLWGNDSVDDFALPGDDALLNREGADPPVAEMPVEASERPRDAQGRFTKAEEEASTEETPTETPVEAAPEAAVDPLEALRSDYERRLAEKEAFIQRQGNEIGELRKSFEDWRAEQQAPAAPQVSDWDDLIDQDPAYATELAYANGDQYQLQRAIASWNEVAPGAPRLWANYMADRERYEQQISALQERVAPVAERNENMGWAMEFQRLQTKYPDLEKYAEKMNEIGSRGGPALQELLRSGSPTAKAEVIETLYARAKLESGDTLATSAQQLAAQAAESERRARDEAVVVSASRTAPEQRKSEGDLMAEEWDKMDRISQGWNIGPR